MRSMGDHVIAFIVDDSLFIPISLCGYQYSLLESICLYYTDITTND